MTFAHTGMRERDYRTKKYRYPKEMEEWIEKLGIVSHKMSLITFFGYKHFSSKFGYFSRKKLMAINFCSYLESNC